MSIFTDRETDLLLGKAVPESNDEWNWLQDHANDIVQEFKEHPETPARKPFYPGTHASHVHEAMYLDD